MGDQLASVPLHYYPPSIRISSFYNVFHFILSRNIIHKIICNYQSPKVTPPILRSSQGSYVPPRILWGRGVALGPRIPTKSKIFCNGTAGFPDSPSRPLQTYGFKFFCYKWRRTPKCLLEPTSPPRLVLQNRWTPEFRIATSNLHMPAKTKIGGATSHVMHH